MDFVAPFKALADETRLRLLVVLGAYELNVNELTDIFTMGQSRISRHLRILNDAGLIEARRHGQWTFYHRKTSAQQSLLLSDGVLAFLKSWPETVVDLGRAAQLISQRSAESERFFNAIADTRWSRMKAELNGGVDLDAHIVDWLEEKGTVADIGCGGGELLQRLGNLCRRVIGVDRSASMLEQVADRFQGDVFDLRVGDAAHLPLGDGEADAVVVNMVLHHLPQPNSVFLELSRVTRPGGQILVVELAAHQQDKLAKRFGDVWQGFLLEELSDWLSQGHWRMDRYQKVAIGFGLEAFVISAKKNIS